MCPYSKPTKAPPNLAGLFVSSVGEKARGVYIAGDEVSCGNGASYFAYLTSGYTSLLSYLRDGSETNTATVRMNYCKPYEDNLPSPLNQSVTYSVTDYIISAQQISNGYAVLYKAGSYIELNDGFVSGTDFVAEIDPCIITRTVIASKTEDIIEEPQQNISSATIGDIRIYPTVVALGNAINVEVTEAQEKLQIDIYDLQGKRIFQTTFHNFNASEPNSILLRNIASGFYLVKAEGNSVSTTQKIIIK